VCATFWRIRDRRFSSAIRDASFFAARRIVSNRLVITGQVCRRSLYDSPPEWHRVHAVTPLRELRRAVDLSQQAFAALIAVPVNTFRMWDSGLRPTPPHLLQRAAQAVTEHPGPRDNGVSGARHETWTPSLEDSRMPGLRLPTLRRPIAMETDSY
jgi:hypothetical protein